jgi:hypothetical protein
MSAKKSHRQQVLPARHFWLACWLALALLSFQTIAQLHRHVHGHGQAAASAQGSLTASVQLPALDGWGHQAGDLSCQLFDQLSKDHVPHDLAPLDASTATPLLPQATLWTSCSPPNHWKRGARGPPFLA